MTCHVLLHRLFGVALHHGVDRRIDLQSIGVDIIGGSVGLAILVAPAVEWVRLPLNAVVSELGILPRSVVTSVRFIRHHDLAQMLTEVGSYALLMVHTMK